MPISPLPALSLAALPGLANLPERQRRQGSAPIPEITEEEEQSLLGRIMGGLEYGALTLDKPGAAVRGSLSALMGGEAGGGLLNLIPFSDTLGITDPSKRVYGRDLLVTAGIAPENKAGLGEWVKDPTEAFWDIAGFGTEVLLDPMWAVRGPRAALTAAGKAAETAAKVTPKLGEAAKTIEQAAKGARVLTLGTTPAARANEIEQGLRGLAAIKLPFAKEPLAVFGAGSKTAANVYRNIAYAPGWRHIKSLWAPSQMGQASYAGALAADNAWHTLHQVSGAVGDMTPAFRQRHEDLSGLFGELAEYSMAGGDKMGADQFGQFSRHIAEQLGEAGKAGAVTAKDIQPYLTNIPFDLRGKADEFSGKLAEFVNASYDVKDKLYGYAQNLGMRGEWLESTFMGHMPRSGTRAAKETMDAVANRQLFSTAFKNSLHRLPFLDVPEGTLTINKLAQDPLVGASFYAPKTRDVGKIPAAAKQAGLVPDAWVEALDRSNFGRIVSVTDKNVRVHFISPEGAHAFKTFPHGMVTPVADMRRVPLSTVEAMPTPQMTGGEVKAGLRDWLETNRGAKIPKNVGVRELRTMYVQDKLTEALQRQVAMGVVDPANLPKATAKVLENSEALATYLSRLPPSARQQGIFTANMVDDLFDYMEHLAIAASNGHTMHNLIAGTIRHTNLKGAQPGAMDIPLETAWGQIKTAKGRPVLHSRGLDTLVQRIGQEQFGNADPAFLKQLRSELYVSPKTLKALNAQVETMMPQSQSWMGQLYDQYQAALKAHWTLPWPSFHSRNFVDGQWRNIASAGDGAFSIMQYIRAGKEASDHLHGKPMEWVQEIKDISLLKNNRLMDISGEAARGATGIPEAGLFKSLRGVLSRKAYAEQGEGWLDMINPANIRGTAYQKPMQSIPFEMGERAYGYVEYMNRVAPYIALRRNGMTPSQAKHWVDMTQFNYSEASPWGRQYGKKLVPFFGFLSHNLPYQFSSLLARPGGRHAQTLRAINAVQREGSDYTPQWMREKFAVRVAGEEDQATILRSLGLSIEDLGNITMERGVPTGRTWERMLSQANPLITTPIKLIAGKDLYTGRQLKDMYSLTGSQTADTVIQATPVSRAISESRFLEDLVTGRKPAGWTALDFMTGLKVGTYDLEKWRLIDQQRLLMRLAQQDPNVRVFQRPYPVKAKPGEAPREIPPETLRNLALLQGLSARMKSLQEKRDRKQATQGQTAP